jgi:hypothetical protein
MCSYYVFNKIVQLWTTVSSSNGKVGRENLLVFLLYIVSEKYGPICLANVNTSGKAGAQIPQHPPPPGDDSSPWGR